MERELTIERTIAGLEQTRANGTYLGAEPMGFKRRAGKLIRNSEERRLIDRIVELRLEGLSLRAIGERLEEEGHKPKRGEHWHAQSLKLILDREGITKPKKKKKRTSRRKKKRGPKKDEK
jgi:DNA invertase Pin-like site-specific DNA recombinase